MDGNKIAEGVPDGQRRVARSVPTLLTHALLTGLCLSVLMPSVHANARVKGARLFSSEKRLANFNTELGAHGLAAPLRIGLAFPESVAIEATVVRQAVAEATAIWAPYGLTLSGTNA